MRRQLLAALVALASIGAGCDLLPTASHGYYVLLSGHADEIPLRPPDG